ncbi:MAG TPA: prepilin-type N-terminal cleavage/methylation domain-containing protein [Sulfurimonas sp.]|nr:prepilin-type N-terminal cleavage/methylation domain-containing protein [Sulfurimonas sp.]
MKKYAFTMIELIFVIIILGILASVAIPKLSATRDDAKVSKTAQMIAISATEIQSYAVSKAAVTNDLSLMSNAINSLVLDNEAVLDIPNSSVAFKMSKINDCISLKLVSDAQDVNLSLSFGASTDPLCNSLQGLFDTTVNLIPLKGSYVIR